MKKEEKQKVKKTSSYYLNKMIDFMDSVSYELSNPHEILYFSTLNSLYDKRLKIEERIREKEKARKKREEELFFKQKEAIIMNQNLSEIKEIRRTLKGALK